MNQVYQNKFNYKNRENCLKTYPHGFLVLYIVHLNTIFYSLYLHPY